MFNEEEKPKTVTLEWVDGTKREVEVGSYIEVVSKDEPQRGPRVVKANYGLLGSYAQDPWVVTRVLDEAREQPKPAEEPLPGGYGAIIKGNSSGYYMRIGANHWCSLWGAEVKYSDARVRCLADAHGIQVVCEGHQLDPGEWHGIY